MNAHEAEKIDMLFDALTADLEQMSVELLKAESHARVLNAKISVLMADDAQVRPVDKSDRP